MHQPLSPSSVTHRLHPNLVAEESTPKVGSKALQTPLEPPSKPMGRLGSQRSTTFLAMLGW